MTYEAASWVIEACARNGEVLLRRSARNRVVARHIILALQADPLVYFIEAESTLGVTNWWLRIRRPRRFKGAWERWVRFRGVRGDGTDVWHCDGCGWCATGIRECQCGEP